LPAGTRRELAVDDHRTHVIVGAPYISVQQSEGSLVMFAGFFSTYRPELVTGALEDDAISAKRADPNE
jgi:hypothetical protein